MGSPCCIYYKALAIARAQYTNITSQVSIALINWMSAWCQHLAEDDIMDDLQT